MVVTSANSTPDATSVSSQLAINWQASIRAALLLAVFGIAYWSSAVWLNGQWSNSTGLLGHGRVVAAISILLLVRSLPKVVVESDRPSWWALLIFAGLVAMWLVGRVATVASVETVAVPAILFVAIYLVFGRESAKYVIFPVGYIYFAMPIWEHFQFIFQAITVAVVSAVLRVAGVPALIEGNTVDIGHGVFEIAGGCSGLSFILAGLSVAALYGHLYYDNLRSKMKLVMLLVAVALLTNWLRVLFLVILGYATNMTHPLVADHLTMGWVLFSVLLVPTYFLAIRWEPELQPTPRRAYSKAVSADNKLGWFAALITVAVMVAGPIWADRVLGERYQIKNLQIELPNEISGWSGPTKSTWDWVPEFPAHTASASGQYTVGDQIVVATALYYSAQGQETELVSSANDIAGNWNVAESFESQVDESSAQSAGFIQDFGNDYVNNWVIWYQYRIGAEIVSGGLRSKLVQVTETLSGRPGAAVIAYASPCRPDCSSAVWALEDFVANAGSVQFTEIESSNR